MRRAYRADRLWPGRLPLWAAARRWGGGNRPSELWAVAWGWRSRRDRRPARDRRTIEPLLGEREIRLVVQLLLDRD